MAVNLSFVSHDEDLAGRGAMERHSLLNSVFTKGLPDDLPSPFSSSPPSSQSYWVRRHSEAVLSHQVPAEVYGNLPLPKNVSSPQILSPANADRNRNAKVSARIRKKAVVDNPYRSVLRQKVDNYDNCCSDSEITVKVPKNEHSVRLNASFSAKSENFCPSNLPLHQNRSYENHAVIQKDVSSKNLPVSSQPISLSSGDSELSPTTAKLSPLTSRSSDSNIPLQQTKSRREFLSLSDTVPDSDPARDVKRAKSYFNVSPSLQKRSPVHGRRKSPYKELSDSSCHRVSHLPPKSPGRLQTPRSSSNRHSDPLARCASEEEVKTGKKHLHTKPGKYPRRSIATDGWHPSDMMTNYQYAGHYQENEKQDNSSASRHQVLDTNQSDKSFDAALFDVLKVSPDEYAKQITLLDLPAFVAITPDEIIGSGWTKKDKWKLSPNVCEMTQRFNNTSFWCIREILNAATLKIRAEVMTHFIKIAKKLHELNNLHSLMAVIQSLNSSSIIRLSKTWALISKSNRSTFDRLLNLVKIDDNRSELRAHMEGIKLPCIPFLGMYLSDVIYIDSAHPSTGGMESQERKDKMNNVLRILADYQQSRYNHLQVKPHIKNYLNSVKYIEELQKFLEEDNYKLSLKIEPPIASNSPEKKPSRFPKDDSTASSSSKPTSPSPPIEDKFSLGHRKSRSLGKEFSFQPMTATRTKSDTCRDPKSGSLPRNCLPAITTSLLDDSIIAPYSLPSASSSSSHVSYAVRGSVSAESSRSATGSEFSEPTDPSTFSEQYSRYWSLPKYKSPTKWYKVYHGNRGKYSLRAVKDKQQADKKSSTYPIAKNTSLRTLYDSYLNEKEPEPIVVEKSNASFVSDIEEFAKMRVEKDKEEDYVRKSDENDDYDMFDDETTLISISSPVSPRTKSRLQELLSRKPTDIKCKKTLGSISNLSLHLSAQAKTLKHTINSPTLSKARSKRRDRGSISEMNISDRVKDSEKDAKAPSTRRLKSSSISRNDFPLSETDEGLYSETDVVTERQCNPVFESPIRRKCVLKHGKKATIPSWTKYWLALCGTKLIYYAAKSITSKTERHHFKSAESKSVSIVGWMLLRSSDPNKSDSFQLSNPDQGTVYRFQCDSEDVAEVWMKVLEEATKRQTKPEKDLINLDDS